MAALVVQDKLLKSLGSINNDIVLPADLMLQLDNYE